MNLPKWTIGNATGTLFKDGNPTGTEVKVFNTFGGTPDQLVAQANAASDLLAALKRAERQLAARYTHMVSGGGTNLSPVDGNLGDDLAAARAAIAKAEERT